MICLDLSQHDSDSSLNISFPPPSPPHLNIHSIKSYIPYFLNFVLKFLGAPVRRASAKHIFKVFPWQTTLFPKGIPHLMFAILFYYIYSLFFWEILTAGQDLSVCVYYKYQQTAFVCSCSSSEIIQKPDNKL